MRIIQPLMLIVSLSIAGLAAQSLAARADETSKSDEKGDLKDPPTQPISSAKLNAYIKGYNMLLSPFGLPAEYRMYAAQQIARKGVNDPVNVSDGWLDQASDLLKKGQAIPGGNLADVDQAADRLVPILDRQVARLKGLEAYYQSRGNTEDNFARGKREDPLVLADFKEGIAAMDQLNTALNAAIERRDTADLAKMKDAGDMIGYDGGLALQKSKALVDLFHSAQDVRDPGRLQQGDALVVIIEGALADERQALDAAKAANDGSHAIRNSGYGIAAERLESLIGQYRDMKRSGNPVGHQLMVGAYNSAVESANIGQ